MLEHIWPTLSTPFRDELMLQCVKCLKSMPNECDAFARIVADITKSRPQTVKSQWRMSNTYGTKLALGRDPQKASPFFALAYMSARQPEVTALYSALGVAHTDLTVAESSITTNPPTQEQFAGVLAKGLDGVAPESVRCMIAVIADAGIDSWQLAARGALETSLASR